MSDETLLKEMLVLPVYSLAGEPSWVRVPVRAPPSIHSIAGAGEILNTIWSLILQAPCGKRKTPRRRLDPPQSGARPAKASASSERAGDRDVEAKLHSKLPSSGNLSVELEIRIADVENEMIEAMMQLPEHETANRNVEDSHDRNNREESDVTSNLITICGETYLPQLQILASTHQTSGSYFDVDAESGADDSESDASGDVETEGARGSIEDYDDSDEQY